MKAGDIHTHKKRRVGRPCGSKTRKVG